MTPLEALKETYRKWAQAQHHIAHIHGKGVGDYADQHAEFGVWLAAQLAQKFVVVQYTRTRGIEFPAPGQEQIARDAVPPETQQGGLGAFASLQGGGIANDGDADFPTEIDEALPYLEKLAKSGPIERNGTTYDICIIFPYADLIWPENNTAGTSSGERAVLETLLLWADDSRWVNGVNHPLILLITEGREMLNQRIRSKAANVPVTAPDEDARRAHIEFELSRELVTLDSDLSPARFASLTAGLSRRQISDVFSHSEASGEPISRANVRQRAREADKAQLDGVLVIEDPTGTLSDVAGHEHVIEYFRNDVIGPMTSGDVRGVPRGILLMGPPGTGKSWLAQKLASEAGVNFVELRMARILGQYVGQSEGRLELALQGIQARTPCILFVDEFDQMFQRGQSNGNQVGQNLFGRFLQFLSQSDIRGRVLFVAATNRPDLIDAAMRRSGRFDAKIPLMPPSTDAERVEMFATLARVHDLPLADSVDLIQAAQMCNEYTGADIEAVLNEAWRIARRQGHQAITESVLLDAIADFLPGDADAEFMGKVALAEANNLKLVPEAYRNQVRAARKARNEGAAQAQPESETNNERRVRKNDF